MPTALVTFNLGVEAGQLLIVGAMLAALAAVRRSAPAALVPAARMAAYAIGITASYWFVARMIG